MKREMIESPELLQWAPERRPTWRRTDHRPEDRHSLGSDCVLWVGERHAAARKMWIPRARHRQLNVDKDQSTWTQTSQHGYIHTSQSISQHESTTVEPQVISADDQWRTIVPLYCWVEQFARHITGLLSESPQNNSLLSILPHWPRYTKTN